jgi:predicted RNA polymerase sigma factor
MMFHPNPTPIPPPSAAEIIGYALTREAEADHYMRLGLHQEARRQWERAVKHRNEAEAMR